MIVSRPTAPLQDQGPRQSSAPSRAGGGGAAEDAAAAAAAAPGAVLGEFFDQADRLLTRTEAGVCAHLLSVALAARFGALGLAA